MSNNFFPPNTISYDHGLDLCTPCTCCLNVLFFFVFFNTHESIATQRAFLVHFILHWNDPVLDRFFNQQVSKVGNRSQWQRKGFLFNTYYTEVLGAVLLLSLDCSTLPLIHIL